jgi:hypothetical protein
MAVFKDGAHSDAELRFGMLRSALPKLAGLQITNIISAAYRTTYHAVGPASVNQALGAVRGDGEPGKGIGKRSKRFGLREKITRECGGTGGH